MFITLLVTISNTWKKLTEVIEIKMKITSWTVEVLEINWR